MSTPASDKTVSQPAAKKTADEAPESVFLVPYPKIVFLYPTFLMAIVAALWTHFLGKPLARRTTSQGASARCSSACSQ